MKYLAELSTEVGFSSVDDMVDSEIQKINDIRFKTVKKNMALKLNQLFDGFFLESFDRYTYGNFLSRALTAYVISKKFNIPEVESATYITDDVNDFGIDAIYFFNNILYLFQTKFSKSLDPEEIRKIKEGIKRILSFDDNISVFNSHILKRKNEINKILLIDDIKIVPVIIFYGQQVSPDVKNFFYNEIKNNQEYGDFIDSYQIITNEDIFEYEVKPNNITEVFTLDKFFERNLPVKMYAGCIKISFLKVLYSKYKERLFNKNIRFFIEESNINKGIKDTLTNEPENFIYYNNGITFVCDKIKEMALGATSDNIKTLKLTNMSIVNGAQTVISSSSIQDIPDEALVQIRIIETPPESDKLSLKITQFNNSQNRVSAMDLRTLDPIHLEIKKYFIQNGYYYHYKTGEKIIPENGFNFEDLMVSLGCFFGHSLIVKNNKGELWENYKLYTDLLLIRNYQVFLILCIIKKSVDIKLENYIKILPFLIHWNRLVLELVFKKMNINLETKLDNINLDSIDEILKTITDMIFCYVQDNEKHTNIFHRQKGSYDEIRNYILKKENPLSTQKQGTLFDLL